MTTSTPSARFLMCRPEHFAVDYAINPWMDPERWAREEQTLAASARKQWLGLYRTLADLGAEIELVPPVPGLPDLVFTANAAVVLDGTALLARFRHPERRREEPQFEGAFRMLQARGLIKSIKTMPEGLVLEGAGDCVFDHARNLFWMGFGPRSDGACRRLVEDTFGVETVALELADDRFYHMDTAFCPLPHGEAMYVPEAFTAAGRATIEARIGPSLRIPLDSQNARRLAANAVCIGNTVVMSGCNMQLRDVLTERGYRVRTNALGSFLRSGGSAFCLTLQLDRRSAALGRRRAVA
jgi:N-dimethylarginine dimethylaminohydrolase